LPGVRVEGLEHCAAVLEGTRVLGSIFYVRPGSAFAPKRVLQARWLSHTILRDVVAYVPPGFPTKRPLYLFNCKEPGVCVSNVCENCLAVHDGTPSVNDSTSGWTLPGFREGRGLAAATGGTSAFVLLPGICKRYVAGVLTETPLWPWPMNERIKEARIASGRPAVDVTAQVEAMLGPIPAACRADSGSVPPPPTLYIIAPR
jgi:hypothetical protein